MSASIDEKVVRLKLENAGFKAGITSAIDSLKSLNNSLKMKGAADGLTALSSAASRFSLAGVQDAVAQTTQKFPMLEGIATVALGNIAAKAATVGAGLVKSLALDGITDGFKEYELQLNSVQTILANTKSKGETIDTVNAALDELNTYADKTIYNFGQMTSNIGLFTAAGVGLGESVSSIKGLSNLAASSGVGATEASRAMYQLSQAIASGTVKLMDWNSIQNAGLGGETFKNALIETARAHGVAVDDIIAKQGSFRDSLSEGWLTADIMNETLMLMTDEIENFSDAELQSMGYTQKRIDQMREFAQTAQDAATKFKTATQIIDTVKEMVGSGWATTWRLLIGDFEEASELWTTVGNKITGFIDQANNARNAVVEAFVEAGGRTELLRLLGNTIQAILNPIKAIAQGFKMAFGGPNGAAIASFVKYLADLAGMFVLNEKNVGRLANIVAALLSPLSAVFTVVGWGLKILGGLAYAVLRVAGAIASKLVTALLVVLQPISAVLRAVNNFIKGLDPVGKAVTGFKTAFGPLIDVMSAAVSSFTGFFKTLSKGFVEPLSRAKEAVKSFGSAISGGLLTVLKGLGIAVIGPFALLALGIQKLVDLIGGPLINGAQTAAAILSKNLGKAISFVSSQATAATAKVQEFVAFIGPKLKSTIDSVKSTLSALKTSFVQAFSGSAFSGGTFLQGLIYKIGEAFVWLRDKAVGVKDSIQSLFSSGSVSSADGYSSVFDKLVSKLKFYASNLKTVLSQNEKFASAFEKIEVILEKVKAAITSAVSSIEKFKNAFISGFTGIGAVGLGGVALAINGIGKAISSLGNTDISWGDALKNIGTSVLEFFKSVVSSINIDLSGPIDSVGNAFSKLGSKISEVSKDGIDLESMFKNMEKSVSKFAKETFNLDLTSIINAIKIAAKTIKEAVVSIFDSDIKVEDSFLGWFINDLPGYLKEAGSKIAQALKGIGSGVGEFTNELNSVGMVGTVISGLSIGGVIAMVKTFKDIMKGLTDALGVGNIGDGLSSIGKAIESFSKESPASEIFKIAAAIGILALALLLLAQLPSDKIAQTLGLVAANLAILIGAIKVIDKLDVGGISAKTFVGLVGLAAAVLILSYALAKLAMIKGEDLIKAEAAIGGLMLALMALMKVTQMTGGISFGNAMGLAVTAGSVYILALAIAKLGSIPANEIQQGSIVAGGILVALVAFSRISGMNIKFTSAAAFLGLAFALVQIAKVIGTLGSMGLGTAIQGMIMLGVVIAMMAGIFYVMQTMGNLMGVAAAFLAMAIVLWSAGNTVAQLGLLPFAAALQGVIALAAVMAILVVAMLMAQSGVMGAAALGLLAVALVPFIAAITLMAGLSWAELAVGLVGLAAALAILIVAGMAATAVAPGLLALSTVAISFGLGVMLAAVGVMIFSLALGILAVGLISIVGSLMVFAQASSLMIQHAASMLGMVVIMAVLGAALVVLGVGALVAGIGFAVLGAAFLALGMGFMMVAATAIPATIALKAALKTIAQMFGWDLAKAAAVGLVLLELGVALLAFGLGAAATAIGAGLMAATLPRALNSLVKIGPALDKLKSSLEGAAEKIAEPLNKVTDVFSKFSASVTSSGAGITMLAMSLMMVKMAVNGIQTGVVTMSQAMITGLTVAANAFSAFSTQVGTSVTQITMVLMGFTPMINSLTQGMAQAFTSMSVSSNVALIAFIAVIRTASTNVQAAMTSMADIVLQGCQSVVLGFTVLSGVTKSTFSNLQASVMVGSAMVSVAITLMAARIQQGSSLVISGLTMMNAGVSANMSRMVTTFNMSVAAATIAINNLANGVRNGMNRAVSAASQGVNALVSSMVSRIASGGASVYAAAYSMGYQIVAGVTNGINANRSMAINAAGNMATAALNQAKANLAIHSPSREFYKVGNFIDQGMANGINENADAPIGAVRSLSQSVMSTADKILGDALDDFNPTITPVIDSSELRKGASDISKIFGSRSVGFGRLSGDAQLVAASRNNSSQNSSANGTSGGVNNYINYTQNNTSPRALDDYEIYRQTRRQVESLKRSLRDK